MPAHDDLPEVGDVVRRGGQARFDLDSVPADPNAAPDPTGPSLPRVQDRAPTSGSHEAARPASPIPPVEPPGAHPPPPRPANTARQPTHQGGGRRPKGRRRSISWAAPWLLIVAVGMGMHAQGPNSPEHPTPRTVAPVAAKTTLHLTVPDTKVSLSTVPGHEVSMDQVDGCAIGGATNTSTDTSRLDVTCSEAAAVSNLDIAVPEGMAVEVVGGSDVKASGRYRSLAVSENSDDVELTHVQGDLRVQTRGKVDGTVESASHVDVVSNDGNDVDLEFADRVGDATITTAKKGSVKLKVAENRAPAYDLNLEAHGGSIKTDLTDHDGMPNQLTITTAGGDIRVR